MKKVVVISTSIRAKSNSEILANAFAEGARAAGHEVQYITLKDKQINFCKGCLACFTTCACAIKDDVPAILEQVVNADVVAWATPIYYYEMSGQMKTLIDRLNPMYKMDYKFRDVYMMTVAAEAEDETPERAISGLQGWIDCFPKASLKGTLFCGGVNAGGDILGNAKIQDAYEMGKRV